MAQCHKRAFLCYIADRTRRLVDAALTAPDYNRCPPNFCRGHRNIKTGHLSGIAMCGRYNLAADLEDIQQRFELFASDLTYSPKYNIAPTQPVLAVTNYEGRQPEYLRWGLIPSWAKSASVGNRLINARPRP